MEDIYMWLIYHTYMDGVNLFVNFVDPWTQEGTIFTGANHQKITIYDRKVWSHQKNMGNWINAVATGHLVIGIFWRIISKIKRTSQNSQKQKSQHLSIFWQVVKHNYLHIVFLNGGEGTYWAIAKIIYHNPGSRCHHEKTMVVPFGWW